jgi:hypothetical protein
MGLADNSGTALRWDFSSRSYTRQFKAVSTELQWRTFLSDGSFYEGLPEAGLLGATEGKSERANSWGTWTREKNRVIVRPSPSRTLEYTLSGEELNEDPKSTGFDTYYKAKTVDGLRLHGIWSTEETWHEADRTADWTGVPVIQFWRDGRFVDRGAFLYGRTEPLTRDNAERHPGSGTYDINGFTLVLRYDDGRVLFHAFTGVLGRDPAHGDAMVYIRKRAFHKQ